MGVVGVGKTTVGRHLAEELGWPFLDADDFHPRDTIAKMARGEALSDADRKPWLDALRGEIDERLESGRQAVIACSALKRAYRRRLGTARPEILLVHLTAARTVIADRLAGREGHFAGPELLQSQLEALEAPDPNEALVIDAEAPPQRIVDRVLAAVGDAA